VTGSSGRIAQAIGRELTRELMRAFAAAPFSGEKKYRRRLAKVSALERNKGQAGEANP